MAHRIRIKLACRAQGKLYLLLNLPHPARFDELSAHLALEGRRIPAALHPLPDAGLADPRSGSSEAMLDQVIAQVPFLNVRTVELVVQDGSEEARARIDLMRAKIASIANHRLRRDLVQKVISVEDELQPGSIQARLLRFLEGEDGSAIWRMDVTVALTDDVVMNEDVAPAIEVLDGEGRPLDFTLYPFEDQMIDIAGLRARRFVYSLQVPYDANYFTVVARITERADGSTGGAASANALSPTNAPEAFCSCDGRFYETKRLQTWEFMKDACSDPKAYARWLEGHRATPEELRAQATRTFEMMPIFSVIIPCYESDRAFLEECIGSVVAQSYAGWELILVDATPETRIVEQCVATFDDPRIRIIVNHGDTSIVGNTNLGIEQAKGDWIAFLDHDDMLEPNALFSYVECINKCDGVAALFCDEDNFERVGEYHAPVFKSTLNLDLLYTYNCVTHFLAVKKRILDEIGLSTPEVTGAQDYDLTLRLVASGHLIEHVPKMLYHWRVHPGSTNGDNIESKPYAEEAGRLALQRHFDARKIAATIEVTEHPFVYRARYTLPEDRPLVSIIIPSKDHIAELDACVRSIITSATYRNFEIIIVENNSELADTFAYYEQICAEFEQIKVITWDEGFNYSAIMNFGVAHAAGSRLLLLNNDTEVITPDFIEEMLGPLERAEVGVVGAKLFFRDGLVQHAGIEVGPFDTIVHVNQDFTDAREGYRGKATRSCNFSAVTGACQMVRRDVYEAIGGYDPVFAVGFNDADFCLRAFQAGYLTVFDPHAKLHHYEFTSRGREEVDATKMQRWEAERALFLERWAEYFTVGDPFSNPHLSLESMYYALGPA